MTTRGAKEDMMLLVAELIEEVLNAPEDDKVIAKVREKVNELFGVGTPLFEEVGPKILGGIILEGGGRRYDASVRAQLANVRSTLASSFMGGGQ